MFKYPVCAFYTIYYIEFEESNSEVYSHAILEARAFVTLELLNSNRFFLQVVPTVRLSFYNIYLCLQFAFGFNF